MNRLPPITQNGYITLGDDDGLFTIRLSRNDVRVQPQGPQINANTATSTIEFDLKVCSDQGRLRSIFRGSFKFNALLADQLDLYDEEDITTGPPIVPGTSYGFSSEDTADALIGIIDIVRQHAPDWLS
jgi:hypothetical protein